MAIELRRLIRKTVIGRDGALRRHRAVQARNRGRASLEFCTVRSAR